MQGLAYLLALSLVLAGCAQGTPQGSVPPAASAETPGQPDAAVSAGLVSGQVLEGAEGPIHYSYILPEGYDGKTDYPLVVTMPGYDRMWFGEDSAGSNLDWNGFLAWTRLEEPMIVVSAQLTDWG